MPDPATPQDRAAWRSGLRETARELLSPPAVTEARTADAAPCPAVGPWTGLPCILPGGHDGDHRNKLRWTWGPGLAEGSDDNFPNLR